MSVNLTLFGEFLVFFILFCIPIFAFISYKVGKRKSNMPSILAFVGGCLALFPLFGLIFIAVLALRKDLPKNSAYAH
ncbi:MULTISPECIES: hypothetical protein [Pseudoalteromonas]|jgi:dipeptide/tripeptide permease|uniref:Uncharacterized protein n=1 Tax=Pseudoalteromonas aliena SW19 TaxID=1314866 RepID=A0ABR9DTT9_9GAMM|nr:MULTISPECIES: hypothetical protein [Pseudoalteromonas]MBB1386447.1 hypothetical protein [Pseudoalteromonas sp. SG45-5]MBB1394487.1 hypothetical protein [Pseudoalteromonas sp. SG44-4]MBB1446899.1 hypothetical protein [Pseudoalteromonas sp. SG41-6]MBE0357768.1 hypothetical protein [Pseudoalteromonas aliena SW19]TMO03891.1 hypothetical protein CWB66_09810 [Pseudoalteromonas sp. S558]